MKYFIYAILALFSTKSVSQSFNTFTIENADRYRIKTFPISNQNVIFWEQNDLKIYNLNTITKNSTLLYEFKNDSLRFDLWSLEKINNSYYLIGEITKKFTVEYTSNPTIVKLDSNFKPIAEYKHYINPTDKRDSFIKIMPVKGNRLLTVLYHACKLDNSPDPQNPIYSVYPQLILFDDSLNVIDSTNNLGCTINDFKVLSLISQDSNDNIFLMTKKHIGSSKDSSHNITKLNQNLDTIRSVDFTYLNKTSKRLTLPFEFNYESNVIETDTTYEVIGDIRNIDYINSTTAIDTFRIGLFYINKSTLAIEKYYFLNKLLQSEDRLSDKGISIHNLNNGNYLISGTYQNTFNLTPIDTPYRSQAIFIELNKSGEIVKHYKYNTSFHFDLKTTSKISDNIYFFDGNVYDFIDSTYKVHGGFIDWSQVPTYTGLQLFYAPNDIRVYPNPTTGNLQLHSPFIDDEIMLEISIYTIEGKQVYKTKRHKGSVLELQNLPKGMYILSAETGEQAYKTKFIKQ
jgi:hypothetical protein